MTTVLSEPENMPLLLSRRPAAAGGSSANQGRTLEQTTKSALVAPPATPTGYESTVTVAVQLQSTRVDFCTIGAKLSC